ncbi:hypothetical protein [Cognatishimia sp. F0-27]|uniref:hypothetical protein n=1 Tax=Cognatishimia sp. F0-27 TaxID=2816855 RepID=UPI001D0C8F19|nr:hypothetical protein [Cognatishimia sp. F0-27]MCC1494065.1 hypothetical protein [Cognatishimia sp. F0-27]
MKLIETKFGAPLALDLEFFNRERPNGEKLAEGDSYWTLFVRFRTGLDSERTAVWYFADWNEANDAKAHFQRLDKHDDRWAVPFRFSEAGPMGAELLLSAGDDNYWPIVFEALQGADVIDENYKARCHVLSWSGNENIEWLKECFGDNWDVAAIFEYCLHHYAKSSLAYLAAQIWFFEYCTEDKYTVGYSVRQLEAIYHGAEDLAQAAAENRRLAGLAGGANSKNKRMSRLEALMVEIERLEEIVPLISEERVLEQAWENLEKAREDVPKTPKTRFDYEVELRSDRRFSGRYRAVFKKTA